MHAEVMMVIAVSGTEKYAEARRGELGEEALLARMPEVDDPYAAAELERRAIRYELMVSKARKDC